MTYQIIRHAQSEFNKMFAIRGLDGLFDGNFIDCNISELGQNQTQIAKEELKSEIISHVYVSPLRRTLETALRIFGEHQSQPKMLVYPHIREFWVSSGDIPGDINQTMKEYPMFDFQMITQMENPDIWWAETMTNIKKRDTLLKEVQNIALKDRGQHILQKMVNEGKDSMEDLFDLRNRTRVAQEFFRQEAKNNEGIEGKRVIVGHLNFFRIMTATEFNSEGFQTNGIDMENCQVKEVSF